MKLMVCGTVAGVSVVHLVIVHGEMDGQNKETGLERRGYFALQSEDRPGW